MKAVFTPTVSGNYRIGFHAVSDQPGYLMLHQVKVSVTANTAGTPAAVSDLKLTADESGAQKVKVEFTAPTKDIASPRPDFAHQRHQFIVTMAPCPSRPSPTRLRPED